MNSSKKVKVVRYDPNSDNRAFHFNNKIVMSFFSNKGGVGKTTITHEFTSMLCNGQIQTNLNKILLMDFDPQMNLTRVFMSNDEFKDHIKREKESIKNHQKNNHQHEYPKDSVGGLYSNFAIKLTNVFQPVRVKGTIHKHVDLIKGSLDLSKIEQGLASRSLPNPDYTFITNLIERMKEQYSLIILDTNGSLSFLNKILLTMCNFIIAPLETDIFSSMTFPLVHISFYLDEFLKNTNKPKFVGYFINKVKVTNGALTIDEKKGKESHLSELKECNYAENKLGELMGVGVTEYLGFIESFTTSERQDKSSFSDYIRQNPFVELSLSSEVRRKQAIFIQLKGLMVRILARFHGERVMFRDEDLIVADD